MFIHLLAITLNLVPPEVSGFSLQLAIFEDGGETAPSKAISFARKKDSWIFAENPKKQVRVDGVECIVTGKNGVRRYDLTDMLGVADKPDWDKLNKIDTLQLDEALSGQPEAALSITGPLEIRRRRDGVNFFLQKGRNKILIGHAAWKLGD